MVSGVVTAVGGGIGSSVTLLDGRAPSEGGAMTLATGRTLTTVGFIGLGVGALAAAVGAVLWATSAPAPLSAISVVPLAGGGVVQFGGSF